MFTSKNRIKLNCTVFLECVSQTPFHVDYSWRIETVKRVNILGVNISSDLKWNVHVSELVRKASTRLYFLRQLKKSHVAKRELLLLYITYIRTTFIALHSSHYILEYGSPLFHRDLPSCLQYEDLERLQKLAMKITYPELSYAKAPELSGLLTLYHKREAIAAKLFDEVCAKQCHSLHKLLPSKYQPSYSQRTKNNLFVQKGKLKDARVVFF